MKRLNAIESCQLAITFPDIPETCIAVHALQSGRGSAWIAGTLDAPAAIVIDPEATPGELLGFGEDVDAMAATLRQLAHWSCIEVSPAIADALMERMRTTLGCEIDRSPGLYFTLQKPAPAGPYSQVRLLTTSDVELYMRAAARFEDDPESARLTLLEGPVVAAIINGQIVTAVEANVKTARYANLTVETLLENRGKGLCTAASALAARVVQGMGLIPLWSCNARNLASRRVAEKLGFEYVSQCIYLIPQRHQSCQAGSGHGGTVEMA
jgi:hypothetical protein